MEGAINLSNAIAEVLIDIGTEKCLRKAKELKSISSNSDSLHLRDLGLNSENIKSISKILSNEKFNYSIKSISLSNNPLICDKGASIFAQNVPKSVREIGMVGCGITDEGGLELLSCIRNLPKLVMICIEENAFSNELKKEILEESQNHSGLAVFL